MKEVIILSHGIFSKRDYNRFGIDILKRNFFVKILDCTAWINKNYWKLNLQNIYRNKEYISIGSKNDFLKFISQTNSPIVIDRLPVNKETNWMRKLLRKRNSLFVDLYLNEIPLPKKNIRQTVLKFFKIIINPRKIINKFIDIFQKKKCISIKSNSNISLVGGLASSNKLKNKEVINAHNMDYDVYLNIKDKAKNNSSNYAVFLDENMVNHAEYSLLNLKPPATEEHYYPALSKFLKNFESATGLKVKIAFHPSYEVENKNVPSLLKDFEYFFGKTAEIIMNSKIILAHQSTSLSYAVLFKKPITFLTSDELVNSWLGPRIENFSQVLNSQLINIDNFFYQGSDIQSFLKINEKNYKSYLDQYIKIPDSPDLPIWEIVTDYIKRKQL